MRRNIFFLSFLIIISAFYANCGQSPAYPVELVMADSAYMQGNHKKGDVLLEDYERKVVNMTSKNLNYLQLLKLESEYMRGSLDLKDTADIISLKGTFSDKDSVEKLSKIQLFLGDVLLKNGNYPDAIDYFLQARDLAKLARNDRLLYLSDREIGDLYFYCLRIFEKSIPYYKEYYKLAKVYKDTLRMAYGARFMGNVYMINSDVDSIIFYFEQAMELAQNLPQKDEIVSKVSHDLYDILIQTEQFEEAEKAMPHDSVNDANWAYWHYEQEHVDSAIYYFEKRLGRNKWAGEVETLQKLAELEKKRGRLDACIGYYEQLAAASDSLRLQQLTDQTLQAEARYNFTSMRQQRDLLEAKNANMRLRLWMMGAVLAVLLALMWAMWRLYRQWRRRQEERYAALEREKEGLASQSQEQLEHNKEELTRLKEQLEEARRQDDQQQAARLQNEADFLRTQNENIEAAHRLREAKMNDLKNMALYQRLMTPSAQRKQLSAREWEQLATALDDIYDQFTRRIMSLVRLSEVELHTCYLLKLGMNPTDIAEVLGRSKSAITLSRKRMYMKFTGKSGQAEDMDQLLQEL